MAHVDSCSGDKSDMKIKRKSRMNIIQTLQRGGVSWCGALDDVGFLDRIYDLERMESYDGRFSSAKEDIAQHRSYNDDWPDYWIFDDDRFNLKECDDGDFLRFLCETVHGVVRPSPKERQTLLGLYNREIGPAGFEIIENEDKFGNIECQVRSTMHSITDPLRNRQDDDYLKEEYIHRKISTMRRSLDSDTDLAIGTSKELVETICKTILKKLDSGLEPKAKLLDLVGQTLAALGIESAGLSEDRTSRAFKRIIKSLTSLTCGIAEFRNVAGTGHGKDYEFRPVDTEYARLAVNSASMLVAFLLDMFKKHSEYVQR